jgi:Winged helix-turn helix
MSMSRDTFYRYRNAHEAGGVQTLLDANQRKPIMKNRVDPLIEKAVIKFATE